MKFGFPSFTLARERGCRSYDPPSTSLHHQFQIKDNKTTILDAYEYPKVSIVFQGGNGNYTSNYQQYLA